MKKLGLVLAGLGIFSTALFANNFPQTDQNNTKSHTTTTQQVKQKEPVKTTKTKKAVTGKNEKGKKAEMKADSKTEIKNK